MPFMAGQLAEYLPTPSLLLLSHAQGSFHSLHHPFHPVFMQQDIVQSLGFIWFPPTHYAACKNKGPLVLFCWLSGSPPLFSTSGTDFVGQGRPIASL
jgi:hypothetical protein